MANGPGARLAMATFLASLACAGQPNTLSAEEKALGFKLLFNGRDLTGWEAPAGNWNVEGGAITRAAGKGGITYRAAHVPDDFELRFEWKISVGGNSGVYYRPGQYEYQVLDNARHPDGRYSRTSAASLYYFAAPARDATRPVGEWNEGRIVCQGTRIEHWLNGEKVVDVDYSRPEWAEAVERLRKRGADIRARGAYLHLQDHGNAVWYRSIRLREIPPAVPANLRAQPAFAEVADDPSLPRVLLIGDSISIGYTAPVRALLAHKANVHRIPDNGGPTRKGLENLAVWLGGGKWDVIHFNWGLHDLRRDGGKHQVPIEEYERNLRELVARLKTTGARLIWASTTPVPGGELNPPRRTEDVPLYNEAAQKIMSENAVTVDDLYSFALPRLREVQLPANVHFTEKGSAALAARVAESILSALR